MDSGITSTANEIKYRPQAQGPATTDPSYAGREPNWGSFSPAAKKTAAPAPAPQTTQAAPVQSGQATPNTSNVAANTGAMAGLQSALQIPDLNGPVPGWADDAALAETADGLGTGQAQPAMNALAQMTRGRGLY